MSARIIADGAKTLEASSKTYASIDLARGFIPCRADGARALQSG